MSKDETKDLEKFLQPFDKEITDLVFWLREFVWDMFPTANELIYDNYNAVAFGWSVTDRLGHTFCSVAVGRTSKNIHFGFYWGNEIDDPKKLLIGNGNQYRYTLVTSKNDFPKTYIKKLLQQAHVNSLAKVKDPKQIVKGLTITKSISAVKRTLKNKPVKKINKMILEHVAIWTDNLELVKEYYIKYFDGKSNNKYTNPKKGFNSYFISFASGARIELMSKPNIPDNANDRVMAQHKGIIHLAFDAGSKQAVDEKAIQLQADGFTILSGPRVTGDGYYEFETLDPDNNRLEVTAKNID